MECERDSRAGPGFWAEWACIHCNRSDQYSSYSELQEGLARLFAQELPVDPKHDVESQLAQLRSQTISAIRSSEGLGVIDIATLLGISGGMAKLVIRPLVGTELEVRGKTSGAKYFARVSLGS